jgi:purine-nucleoside/S-methyl-5'-thioadenosine phosphorylase / adenosine deaminase
MLTPFEADCLTILPGVRHGFFTRQGGVSRGIYASLNCGQGSDDDRVAVSENRSLVAGHLGAPGGDIQTVHQIHSANVVIADQLVDRGILPKGDALVTRTPGLAIGVLTADCAPVLFADGEAKVVGAAHAGWRGAISGVVEETIRAMESLGARRTSIRAAVGPAIGAAAYEVGEEFEVEFLEQNPVNARFFRRPHGKTGKPFFDLPGYVHDRLKHAGLTAPENASHCTMVNESLFFSFRRSQKRSEADYGRQISAIVVA